MIMTSRQFHKFPRIFVYYNVDSSPSSLDSNRVEEQQPYSAENAGSKG